jgi:hypothetical protein
MVDRESRPNAESLRRFAYRHLRSLRTSFGFTASDATGLYATLFGRDSLWILIFILESLRIDLRSIPHEWVESAATDIFGSLCALQGSRVRDQIEEQPGKIIHEFRPQLDKRLTTVICSPRVLLLTKPGPMQNGRLSGFKNLRTKTATGYLSIDDATLTTS